MTTQKWQFAPRFKRNAYGWKSDTPIRRIKEAVAEIKKHHKKEPVLAAEGAVLFLEKLSPAIEHVDSSSGAIGGAVNRAIDALVPLIAAPDVDTGIRRQWLERLWAAFQDDEIPYLESLGDHWGQLCGGPELAAAWADDLKFIVESVWAERAAGRYSYFKGTIAYMSALYAAGRDEELLAQLDRSPQRWWYERRWGAMALVRQGKPEQAIDYAEASRGPDDPQYDIAQFCEGILLANGQADAAYARYALRSSRATTNLATYRSIAKKYPQLAPETILRDLAASQPGQEGKWFAAAKDAGCFDLAIELLNRSPGDPRTLARAARDFSERRPEFAIAAGMHALSAIVRGYGYDITGADVFEAYGAVLKAAPAAGLDVLAAREQVAALLAAGGPYADFVSRVLGSGLAGYDIAS